VFSLIGRRALLAGGAGGLGSAIAVAFAQQGAAVAIADLRRDVADDVAARVRAEVAGAIVVSVEMDVTDEQSVADGVAAATAAIGPADIVVPAAGVGELQPIETMTYAQWRSMVAIHLDGTFLVIRNTIGPMLERGHGRYVCFSSIASLQGVADQAHYAAGKGGVDGLVRSFAREVAGRGVTVNAIAPGYIESPLNSGASPARMESLRSNVPVGRFGRPQEIGALAVYLASDEAAYTTGQIISPNGGFVYCNHIVER
jgi:NAD(P)-dependent dehydrogenase (short-subunit alcohol dehydrogenase family)